MSTRLERCETFSALLNSVKTKPTWIAPLLFSLFTFSCAHGKIKIKSYYEELPDSVTYAEIREVADKEGKTRYRLLDKKVTHEERRAAIEFAFPQPDKIEEAYLIIEAHNDDPIYRRVALLEVDGKRGALGTFKEGNKSFGPGVLGQKGTVQLKFNLAQLILGHPRPQDEGPEETLSILDILKKPGIHKITAWISTYEKFGPDSWITLDLFITRRSFSFSHLNDRPTIP